VGQLLTGALSDLVGRKGLIVGGMWIQAAAIVAVASSSTVTGFAIGNVLLGIGTAMVYPTLLAATGDLAHPTWRGTAIGVYRFWRDLGYAFGAVVAGVVADAAGLLAACWIVALLTFASGVVVLARVTGTKVE
jgi:MFS family permease